MCGREREREGGDDSLQSAEPKASETKQNSFSRHGLHINTAAHSTGMLITVARCVSCLCNIWAVCRRRSDPDVHSP